MPSPYNLEVEYNCGECRVRAERLFCNMSSGTVGALDAVKFTGLYPKGSLLFVEGEEPRGIFILCILTLFIGGSPALFALRFARIADGLLELVLEGQPFAPGRHRHRGNARSPSALARFTG